MSLKSTFSFFWIFLWAGAGWLGAQYLPDYVITDLSKTKQNQLVVNVANQGPRNHQGPLMFKIFENENFKRQITMRVDIPAGQAREIKLDYHTAPISCGRWFQIIVNPDGILDEANGIHGNSILKRLFAECYRTKLANRAHVGKGPVKILINDGVNIPYVRVTPDLCKDIVRIGETGFTTSGRALSVTLPIRVFLKNCGYCERIRDVWVKIMQGSHKQLVYIRKAMSAKPGSTFGVDTNPKFSFTPKSDGSDTVVLIRFEGGFRQDGGDMSIRESSRPFWARIYFSGFKSSL